MLRTTIPAPPCKRTRRGAYHPYAQGEVSPCAGREGRGAGTMGPSADRIKQEGADDGASLNITVNEGSNANTHAKRTLVATRDVPRPRDATKASSEAANLKAEIRRLKERVQELDRTTKRLRNQLLCRGELLKDARGERDEARTECVNAEERLEQNETILEALQREADRYRGWWLTDYYSLKVVLGLVPNKNDVEAIAAASRDRYAAYIAAAKKQQ